MYTSGQEGTLGTHLVRKIFSHILAVLVSPQQKHAELSASFVLRNGFTAGQRRKKFLVSALGVVSEGAKDASLHSVARLHGTSVALQVRGLRRFQTVIMSPQGHKSHCCD